MGLAACLEESSESGTGHSNRLLGLRRFSGASNVVSRGQGPKQRFSWQRGDGVGAGSGKRELTVSSLFSRVSCRVSFRLVFSEGEKKKRRWEG